ncbi:MAG: hypothetical protein QN168_05755 [Armatimonadota bacterium]|nr:hypothetical protein [Armatimonadota bacterium]
MLHGLLVGFVFAMIFAHAPVILPAVLGRPVPGRPAYYVHVILMHASLAMRVLGDLAGWMPLREWGGLLNVAAVLLFLANTVRAAAGAARA